MRASLLGATLVALTVATPTFAADYDFAPPPKYSWTGCHIGGHLGLGGVALRTLDLEGFAGGGQVGCDYQLVPGWVAGLEGRLAWTSMKRGFGAIVTSSGAPAQLNVSNDFLASITGRVGFSVDEGWLLFVRGGAAWNHERMDAAFTAVGGAAVDPSATTTRFGWTIGTGAEWALAQRWTATVEYNYYNFANSGTALTDGVNNATVVPLNEAIHTVTVGVNYHF